MPWHAAPPLARSPSWCRRAAALLLLCCAAAWSGLPVTPIPAIAALGPITASAETLDAAAVAQRFILARNAHDVEAALSLFADDAVLLLADGTEVAGTDRLRHWLLLSFAQGLQVDAGPVSVAGDVATWDARVAVTPYASAGLVVEAPEQLTVKDGRIRTFRPALEGTTTWESDLRQALFQAYAQSQFAAQSAPLPGAQPAPETQPPPVAQAAVSPSRAGANEASPLAAATPAGTPRVFPLTVLLLTVLAAASAGAALPSRRSAR